MPKLRGLKTKISCHCVLCIAELFDAYRPSACRRCRSRRCQEMATTKPPAAPLTRDSTKDGSKTAATDASGAPGCECRLGE